MGRKYSVKGKMKKARKAINRKGKGFGSLRARKQDLARKAKNPRRKGTGMSHTGDGRKKLMF